VQSTAALPFGTIVIILVIWGLVTIPLTVAGGIAGKNNKADFAAPCRTNKYPREIPELPWYRWGCWIRQMWKHAEKVFSKQQPCCCQSTLFLCSACPVLCLPSGRTGVSVIILAC
jgi:hypothetical protein